MFSHGLRKTILLALCLVQGKCDHYDSCSSQKCEVRIHIESGWVCGRLRRAEDGSKYASFRGLPYGKPPLGERRFKELEPVEPWGESVIFYALEDAPACPQQDCIYGRFKHEPRGQSEDCIYMNLHVPAAAVPKNPAIWHNTIKRGLPILVFIHEGAFQAGSGLTDFCGPEFLMTRDIIVITFNFRLNVFGFLSLGCKEIPGNQGLRDMVTLLKWVQRNARAFGGDPNNVTLMGHSGGGTAAYLLSMSTATKGLFRRIIALSCNPIPAYYTASPAYARNAANLFLKELGINETNPTLIHRELVRTSLVKIMSANTMVQLQTSFAPFPPVVEKKFPGCTRVVDDCPINLFAMGRGRHYPILMGFTNNEMDFAQGIMLRKGLLEKLKLDPTADVSLRHVYSLPKNDISRIGQLVQQKYYKGKPTLKGVLKYYTDMYLKHPALKAAEWRAAMSGAPFYLYQFAYEAEDSLVKKGFWTDYSGAAHFDDYLCIFRANSILDKERFYPPKCEDDNMRFYMVDMVTNFMYCGNPTCETGYTTWPPVSKNRTMYNYITEPFSVKMRPLTAEERDIVYFFDSFDPQVRRVSAFLANQRNIDSCPYDEYFKF